MAKILVRTALSVSDFEVIYTIGAGSYGTVKKVRRIKDDKIFVWKELDYSAANEADKQMLVSEVNLLRELKHENIVKYMDRIIDKKNCILYLIMEYCEGGDLATYIVKAKKEGHIIEESFVWKVCFQLAQAIKECHSGSRFGKSVLHRDLKPANIFLDAELNVKLGDFGLARVLKHDTSFAKTCVGTPLYMSPEQMSGMKYNEKSDMWALGCLLYELCTLRPPFVASNQIELASKICAGIFDPIPKFYSKQLSTLINSLLSVNKDKRPSIDALLKNRGIQGIPHSMESVDGGPSGAKNPVAPLPPVALVSEIVESLKKENNHLREELASKDLEIKKKEAEIETKIQEIEKRSLELDSREKNLLIAEQTVQEKMFRAERLIQMYKEVNLKFMHSGGEVVCNSFDDDSPWRRVSSPSVIIPYQQSKSTLRVHSSGSISPKNCWNRGVENDNQAHQQLNSKLDCRLTSPRNIIHSKVIDHKRRVAGSDDRKPLMRLDKVEPYKEPIKCHPITSTPAVRKPPSVEGISRGLFSDW